MSKETPTGPIIDKPKKGNEHKSIMDERPLGDVLQ